MSQQYTTNIVLASEKVFFYLAGLTNKTKNTKEKKKVLNTYTQTLVNNVCRKTMKNKLKSKTKLEISFGFTKKLNLFIIY